MDLDREAVAHNTPEARASLVNAPAWTDGLTVLTYPGGVPSALTAWLGGLLTVCVRAAAPLGRDISPVPSRSYRPAPSVALWGPVGAGKTGLGIAALRALAAAGVGSAFYWNMVTGPGLRAAVDAGDAVARPSPCWYESWPRLLALHRRERWDEESWFDQLEERVAVLMLDDVGVDAGTAFRESFLLRHVEWAADRPGRSLVLTVNDRPADWVRTLGERLADRLLDASRFAVVEVPGASRR